MAQINFVLAHILHMTIIIYYTKAKGKVIPLQAQCGPEGG